MKHFIVMLALAVGAMAFSFPDFTGPQGPQGIQGEKGDPGINGSDGSDYIYSGSGLQTLEKRLQSTALALGSVELDPSREGFSIGIGASPFNDIKSGAVGLMYGTGNPDYPLGVNVKAYRTEGNDDHGVGVGLTLGF